MIDTNKVFEAMMKVEVAPLARTYAAELVEAWIERLNKFPDTHIPSLGVETPWYMQLAPKLYVVGMTDRILDDEWRTVCEWKTRKAPKIRKDGMPYKGDTEDDWMEDLNRGPQPRTYALAAKQGKFWVKGEWVTLGTPKPRVMIRAIVKSKPPDVWPGKPEKGIFEFDENKLRETENALHAESLSIRALRKSGIVPWSLTGYQCKQFGRECGHYRNGCSKQHHPPIVARTWEHSDPGIVVPRLLNLDPNDPELVILSQSGYQTLVACKEKWRREYLVGGEGKDDSEALDVGTVFHAALACVYQQLSNWKSDGAGEF